MGVDVNLYVEGRVEPEQLAAAEVLLKERCSIADEYRRDDGTLVWPVLAVSEPDEWQKFPRISMNVTCRYWGPGYERGDWPSIYGAIALLQSLFPEFPLYYGGDTDDDGLLVTDKLMNEYWLHFVGPDGNGYRERNRAFMANLRAKHSPDPAADPTKEGEA